ncbi:hypothetical protein AXF42_Ash020133 [Apostasia shenzhenica]|uniref:DUF679 domain membrane protein 2 n=1 Tax=Apostasia shenzhenica TaxID=1088818 RepID=A0A2I0A3R7_9ASPA|nr:hypothetical protein AXF42_Ash020133 [Apostasia shenzhenica]
MADIEAPNGQHNPKQPLLLQDLNPLLQAQKEKAQNAIVNGILKQSAHLANLLPTGTVLAFQILSPILTGQGQCSAANKIRTASLLSLCALSCFILSFTDSFRDGGGSVRHGIATFRGAVPPEAAKNYRIRFVDFVHAFMSVMVFVVVVLVDQNVVACFYPMPSEEEKLIIAALPVGIGAVCSFLFVAFPTTRHGIGFPLSSH